MEAHVRTRTRTPFGGGLDSDIAMLARWADEDPAVMRRLLADERLRVLLGNALDDVKPTSPPTSRVTDYMLNGG